MEKYTRYIKGLLIGMGYRVTMAKKPTPNHPKEAPPKVDPQLEELSRRMTVIVDSSQNRDFEAIHTRPEGGTGGVFHAERPDGSVGRYIITNDHIVADAPSVGQVNAEGYEMPNRGFPVQGQSYHVFYDADRNPGLARLVSHALNNSGSDHSRDQAILQILDPVRDREEVRAVLQHINPAYAAQFDAGMPVLSANPSSVSIDQIEQSGNGNIFKMVQFSGYPMGLESDAARNRKYDFRLTDKHQFETVIGTAAAGSDGMFIFPQAGGTPRVGHSGSIVFDTRTHQPVAIMHAWLPGLTDDEKRDFEKQMPGYKGQDPTRASSLYPAANEIRRIEAERAQGHYVTVEFGHAATNGFASDTRSQNPYQLQPGLQPPLPVMLQLPSGVTHDAAPVSGSDLMTLPAPQASVPLPRIVTRGDEGR